MSGRERAEELVARWWPAGVCHYCRCTEDNACKLPNGDPCGWFVAGRNVCNAPACIRAFQGEVERMLAEMARRPRKRTPGEVHEQILEEARQKRRQYREAAKARRKGRVA